MARNQGIYRVCPGRVLGHRGAWLEERFPNMNEGNPWAIGLAKLAVGLLVNRIPDASMSCPVGFMVGIWMMFSVVVSPVFSSSIPVIPKLVLGCAA